MRFTFALLLFATVAWFCVTSEDIPIGVQFNTITEEILVLDYGCELCLEVRYSTGAAYEKVCNCRGPWLFTSAQEEDNGLGPFQPYVVGAFGLKEKLCAPHPEVGFMLAHNNVSWTLDVEGTFSFGIPNKPVTGNSAEFALKWIASTDTILANPRLQLPLIYDIRNDERMYKAVWNCEKTIEYPSLMPSSSPTPEPSPMPSYPPTPKPSVKPKRAPRCKPTKTPIRCRPIKPSRKPTRLPTCPSFDDYMEDRV